jgi:hypothetical protein
MPIINVFIILFNNIKQMSRRDVRLVICVLMTDFANWTVWKKWENSNTSVGFVAHTKEHVSSPHRIEHPVRTQWGDASLVHAELLLYHTAVERFPNATMFLLVSGDSVPTHSCVDVLQYYKANPLSQIVVYTGKNNEVKKRKGTKPKEIKHYYVSDQFKALSLQHVQFLMSDFGRQQVAQLITCHFYTPRRTSNFAPDEIIIPTILMNQFAPNVFNNTPIVSLLAEDTHAKLLVLSELVDLLENAEPHEHIIRKVRANKNMQQALQRSGVFGQYVFSLKQQLDDDRIIIHREQIINID